MNAHTNEVLCQTLSKEIWTTSRVAFPTAVGDLRAECTVAHGARPQFGIHGKQSASPEVHLQILAHCETIAAWQP